MQTAAQYVGLTLPSGWADCYTYLALRPYQFGPEVTVIGCEAETSAVKPKSAAKPNKSPATWDW